MSWIVQNLWLIPLLPLLAAGVSALLKRPQRAASAALAIGSMAISFCLSCVAFAAVREAGSGPQFVNFQWFDLGTTAVRLGFVLDPLAAVMLVMVTFVSLLIFIYSTGYMAHDANFTRFFCFLSLFAAAMLGIVIANSLLLLFICWELVGLASYLLIGFWFHKPSAAAAAKKAFITTRIGDLGLLLGMVWLYGETGTLLFYDNGNGCLESAALRQLVTASVGGLTLSTAIGLLIFCGAIGKSGQVPLHVWLPDAMEGPTPVSALIHAATMVAAGVFLVARVFPLMAASAVPEVPSIALQTVTWVGGVTALLATGIAVAQNDIKRILAYSTVSQLGYMMMGLGMGGVAVGMFHLITHAFFKALLFLGAGSVIHGCHEEQDIRRLGGLRKLMPVTFVTYAVGMAALAGVPVFFSGFWSKDEILHSAHQWPVSSLPFYFGIAGAFLTAFYMTRQVALVFFGSRRGDPAVQPHESPRVMTVPLVILAVCAVLPGFLGTPAWPWFSAFLAGQEAVVQPGRLVEPGVLGLMLVSALVAGTAMGVGWWVYRHVAAQPVIGTDPLQRVQPTLFRWLSHRLFLDELYAASVVRLQLALARFSDWLDRAFWGGAVRVLSALTILWARLNRRVDEDVVNLGFDHGCEGLRGGSTFLSRLQDGQIQSYLRTIGLAAVALLLVLIWGCR